MGYKKCLKNNYKKLDQTRKIYSERCWINEKLQPATVCLAEGKIVDIIYSKADDAEDIGQKILMPGVIDVHIHINEPGRIDWEGFDTATSAAAAGGTTLVVDMPLNASPVTTTLQAFNEKLEASKGKLNIHCGFYAGLIPGNAHKLEGLIKAGVAGVKCFLTHSGIDEFPNVTEKDLEEAMPIIAKYGVPLLVHCELETPVDHDLAEHPTSYASYLQSRPRSWENNAVALMIKLCRKFNCRVHIVHVSSAEALPLIEAAKNEGLPLTAETCAQYIYFNAADIPDAKTIYKCAPPIRDVQNNHLLKLALQSGVLDFITTDHSPAPPSIKEIGSGNLQKAWGGIAGIQWLLPAAWTGLKELLTLETFIPLLTSHPAAFIGVSNQKGKIEMGYDADLVIWNPDLSTVVQEEDVLFRHKISPYIGETLWGKVEETIVNGITVYQNKKLINKNNGQWFIRK